MRGPRREGGSGSHKLDKTTFFYRFCYLYLLYYRIFKYSLKTQDKLVSFWGEGRGGSPMNMVQILVHCKTQSATFRRPPPP